MRPFAATAWSRQERVAHPREERRAAPRARTRTQTTIVFARRLLLGLALVMGVYVLLIGVLAPRYLERKLPQYLEQRTGMPAAVDRIGINPFLLALEVHGFSLGGEAPVLSLDALLVDFQAVQSALRRAWTFDEIRLERPQLAAVVDSKGQLNLAKIADRLRGAAVPEAQQSAGGEPPRLLVRHIGLSRGLISFQDRTGPSPVGARLYPVELELDDLATLPDREGHYALSARLPEAGTLLWHGDIQLQPLRFAGQLEIKGLRLATLWKFAHERLRLEAPEGGLDAIARYVFDTSRGRPDFALDDVRLNVSGLRLTQTGAHTPMLALERFSASSGRFDLANRQMTLGRVEMRGGEIRVAADADGALNWTRIAQPAPEASNAAPEKGESRPWHFDIREAALTGIAVHYTDLSRRIPPTITLRDLQGSLGLGLDLGETTRVTVNDVGLEAGRMQLETAGAAQPLLRIDSVRIADGRIDTAGKNVTAGQVSLSNGRVVLLPGEGEGLALAHAFQAKTPPERKPGGGWGYVLRSLNVSNVEVVPGPPAQEWFAANRLHLASMSIRNLANGGKQPATFDASLTAAQGGTVHARGNMAQDFSRGSAQLELKSLSLQPLQPLVDRYAAVTIRSGDAAASARLSYREGAKPALQLRGSASLRDVRVNDATTGDRLLSWRSLNVEDIRLQTSPNQLAIHEILVRNAGAKIEISRDRQFNLARVIKPAGEEAGEKVERAAEHAARTERERMPVNIGRVRLEGADIDFADYSLVFPFSTSIWQFTGTAVNITTQPQPRAALEFKGRIGEFGSAEVDGNMFAFDPELFTDIRVEMRNVQMPPLTPYSATFLGRKIESGELWLKLNYKIEKGALAGENTVTLQNFTLGDRVEAGNVLDLPLDLAIALLTDSEGRITAQVPVSGRVGDPKFELRDVIFDAIKGLLVKTVTAPFRALGRLFGHSPEERLDSVEFEPGRGSLAPPERQKLVAVANVLKQRPQLGLVVRPGYDPARDAIALRTAGVRRDVAQALGDAVLPGEEPAPVAFADAQTQRALEKLLEDRSGPQAVRAFAAQYEQATGRRPQRLGALSSLTGRASRDVAFYEAMYRRLIELYPLPEGAGQRLAVQRAESIVDYLRARGIDAHRVVYEPQRDNKRQGDIAAVLELERVKEPRRENAGQAAASGGPRAANANAGK